MNMPPPPQAAPSPAPPPDLLGAPDLSGTPDLSHCVEGIRNSILGLSATHPLMGRVLDPITAQLLHLLQILADLLARFAAGDLPAPPSAPPRTQPAPAPTPRALSPRLATAPLATTRRPAASRRPRACAAHAAIATPAKTLPRAATAHSHAPRIYPKLRSRPLPQPALFTFRALGTHT